MNRLTLIDTNVLIDILRDESRYSAWSSHQVERLSDAGEAAVNPLILAELAAYFSTAEALDAAFSASRLYRVELPFDAAFPAGRAYRLYRQRGGTKTSPLPDFLIGAHAQVAGMSLLTRDVRRFRTYFPDVSLISPPEGPQGGAAGN